MAEDLVDLAARAALAGRLIVIPTDTVYGIGTRPDDAAATKKVFEAKRRSPVLELPVLVADVDAAAGVGALGEAGRALAAELWPGPLTLVVRREESSRDWELGGDPHTIGLRVPAHPLALEVLGRTGPLAVSSANHSGEPTPDTCDEVRTTFGDEVEVYVCADGSMAGSPSTVVDLTGSEPVVLREGAADRQIARWLAKNPALDTQNGTT